MLAAALDEAMSLLIHQRGTFALTGRLEIELTAPAPVGSFVELEADVSEVDGNRITVEAAATGEEGKLASARGVFVRAEPPPP